jgi:hypothetical protein
MNPERPSYPKFETEHTRQVEKLPAVLGYNAEDLDPRLAEFRTEAISAMVARDWDLIQDKLDSYQAAAERVINNEFLGSDYKKAQIGLIIDTALMWLEANKVDSYATDIWNARNYARNMEYADITAVLDPAWDEVEAVQLASEAWTAKKNTDEMVREALEHFVNDEVFQEEIKVRATLSPDDFLADMANVLFIYGHDDPAKLFRMLGWIDA